MAPVSLNIEPNALGLLKLAAILLPLYALARVVYNIFLHPLRHFPGPRSHAASYVQYAYLLASGRLAHRVTELHRRYGPVVRIAPNQLSFIDADAWRQIYGHRTGAAAGVEEFKKWPGFYGTRGVPPDIISENKENHAFLRRLMSNGFSDRSMRLQEPIIGSYVDLLVRRLRERCDGDGGRSQPQDMMTWYNWTTFDIIGDLAFGEPFDCLENAVYHPWVQSLNDLVKSIGLFQALRLMGFEWFTAILVKYDLTPSRRDHKLRTQAKIARRAAMTVERPDLIEGLLRVKGLDEERVRLNAGTLIIAGSETTATLLSGVTYLLLANPDKLAKLTHEVRTAFTDDSQITLTSVAGLRYMLACLDEALRMYPPVAGGLQRVVPAGGATISGQFIPENSVVAVWQMAAYHNENNFKDALTYKPERFLDKDSKETRDKFDVLQPFSFGPRNCIGRNLAYAEMRLIMARILYNFDMELVDKNLNWTNHKSYVLWDKPELPIYLTPVSRKD